MATNSRGHRSVKRRLLAEALESRIVLASDLAVVVGGETLTAHLPGEPDITPQLAAAGIPDGDVNGDGVTNAIDIDAVAAAIRLANTNTDYDIDGNGIVDLTDKNLLVREILGTDYGDANLDMQVDAADYEIWSQNQFETNVGWSGGDFDGDFQVDVSDFNVWNSHRAPVRLTLTAGPSSTEIIRSAHPASKFSTVTTELTGIVSQANARMDLGGDLNGDSAEDAADIDMLAAAIREGSTDAFFDLDESGTVDISDLDYMVENILNTKYGDHNLDGIVNGTDLKAVTENAFQLDTGWSAGDFNGDGVTDVSDFNRWNENRELTVTRTGEATLQEPLVQVANTEADEAPVNDDSRLPTGRVDRLRVNLLGDVNGDAELNADDIDMLAGAIRDDIQEPPFDLNNDNVVDQADMDTLIFDLLNTSYGDSNLDRFVDSSDFGIWEQNSYQSDTGWASADFNGDGVTDVSDFNLWNQNQSVVTPASIDVTLADGEDVKKDTPVVIVDSGALVELQNSEDAEDRDEAKAKASNLGFRFMRFM